MARQCRFERSVLSFDEYETIRITHHPAIQDVDGDDLKAMITWLRDMRDKERTHARQKRRETRGKGEARGRSFPGTYETPVQRKQVFAAALKRANKEANRRHNLESRSATIEAAHRALALRREGFRSNRPDSGKAAHSGMRPKESLRRRKTIPPSAIGSMTHATKISQAIHDSRN